MSMLSHTLFSLFKFKDRQHLMKNPLSVLRPWDYRKTKINEIRATVIYMCLCMRIKVDVCMRNISKSLHNVF